MYSKFLEHYRYYSQGNETPEIMHLWCGLIAIAGAIEKRVWIDRSFFKIFLNLYIVLVGPPGVVSKSTSMGLAGDMLKEIKCKVLEDSVLKEKIIQEMQDMEQVHKIDQSRVFPHCSVTFLADELNVLLASGVDMVKFLVTIYSKDKSYHYKTKNSGAFELPNPFLNLISCAVPEWFGRSVAADMSSTGFLARNIIVYEDEKRGNYSKPVYTKEQAAARKKCIEILKKMKNLYGPIDFTPEAEEFYDEWYNKQYTRTNEDYRMAGYYDRKAKTHTPKIAALMALGDEKEQIEIVDLERAIDLLKRTERKMRSAYLIAGGNRLAPYISRIVTMVESSENGRVPMKEIISATWTDVNHEEMKSILDQLYEMGVAVKRFDQKEKVHYLELL